MTQPAPTAARVGAILNALATLAALAAIVYLFRFCWSAVFGSPDTCWILAAGRYIIANHALPAHDVYSWTCPSQPWVLYQWFFEVLCGAVLRMGGLWSVGLIAFVLNGVLLGFFLPRWWLTMRIPSWITFAFSILTINLVWFYVRPQLASFILLPVFLFILERNRLKEKESERSQPGRDRSLWLLPLLMVLWVNLHSFWFLGLMAIACYAIFSTPASRAHLITVLAASCATVFINPYGSELVRYNLSFLHDTDFRGIGELRSPLELHELQAYLFLSYACLCWGFLIARFRSVPTSGLVFAAICTIAALRFARFMPIAILGTWPYLGIALATIDWSGLWNGIAARLGAATTPEGARFALSVRWPLHLLLCILIPSVIWKSIVPNQHAALETLTYQRLDGLEFIHTHHIFDEKLYNDETTGAHMIFLQSGKVFIDNRFDMYGKEFGDKWLVLRNVQPGWQDYLKHYGINAIALEDIQPLFNELLGNPNWLLAYDDGGISYWLSNTAKNEEILGDWKVSPATLHESTLPPAVTRRMAIELFAKHTQQGDSEFKNKNYDPAIAEFRAARAVLPDNAEGAHNLIHALAVAGKRDDLAEALRAARSFFVHSQNTPQPSKSEQQASEDKWVRQSTDELLSKYGWK